MRTPALAPEVNLASFLDHVKSKKLVLVNFYAPVPMACCCSPWEEAHERDPAAVLGGRADGEGGLHHRRLLEPARSSTSTPTTIKIYRYNPHSHESYIGDRTHEAFESFVENNVHDEDAAESVNEMQSEVGAGEGEAQVRGASSSTASRATSTLH